MDAADDRLRPASARIVGRLAADRTNIGTRSIPLLHSFLAQHGDYLWVTFGHPGPAPGQLPSPARATPPGEITSETDHLDQGRVTATVTMQHLGIVVLSASYDPGWTVTIDDRPASTEMVAPALVAAPVRPGTHRIAFTYHGFREYPELLAVSGLLLLALIASDTRQRSRSSR